MERALVLFSGGQDSSTSLAWALNQFDHVETIGFDYGQRHAIEMDCRPLIRAGMADLNPEWAERLGADHRIDVTGSFANIDSTAMTQEAEFRMMESGLPNAFVPGRNLLFFTVAAAVAYRRSIRNLVGGMSQGAYPDCGDDTLKSLQVTINLGTADNYVIHTPLMRVKRANRWKLAEQLGGTALVELIRHDSHTCYVGDRVHWNDWGYGCGSCPACKQRANGWEQYLSSGKNRKTSLKSDAFGGGQYLVDQYTPSGQKQSFDNLLIEG